MNHGHIILQSPIGSVSPITASPVIKAPAVFEPEVLSPNPYLSIEEKPRKVPVRETFSNSSLVDFSPSNLHQQGIFDQFGSEIFPFQAAELPEEKPLGGKTKYFSSGHSDINLDHIEGSRVSYDFETLFIPGVTLVMSPVKGEAMLEAQIKVHCDYSVGDKRLSSARFRDFSEIKPAPLK